MCLSHVNVNLLLSVGHFSKHWMATVLKLPGITGQALIRESEGPVAWKAAHETCRQLCGILVSQALQGTSTGMLQHQPGPSPVKLV